MRIGDCAGGLVGLASRDLAAHVAQSAEHILGKDEVSGSIPLVGSILGMGPERAEDLRVCSK